MQLELLGCVGTHQLDGPSLVAGVFDKTFYKNGSNPPTTVVRMDKDAFDNDPVGVTIDSGKTDLTNKWLVVVAGNNPVILNLILQSDHIHSTSIFRKVIAKVKPKQYHYRGFYLIIFKQ